MTKSNEACNHGGVVSDSKLKDSEVIKCQFESTQSKHLLFLVLYFEGCSVLYTSEHVPHLHSTDALLHCRQNTFFHQMQESCEYRTFSSCSK